ncbi:aspartate ammonia-lyase [Candidatus Thorarchaeota archaeon]|jgi:aspartate ammonia-lyase|nr:MAG: aspartate ammonia-lyase [Candidatus Thorarchaeota archaeon]
MAEDATEYREESDMLGTRRIPKDAYWGVQTLRAKENFGVSLIPLSNYTTLVQALAMVKKACAMANQDLGHLDDEFAEAIIQACDEVVDGGLHDEFVVDMLQGGAGTSTNMNMNEVLASRANEILGHPRNSLGPVSANDHVNMAQSTNDVYPTAIKIAAIFGLSDLSSALEQLVLALDEKAREFEDLLKLGRTEMQDAVPITLGQEFSAWSGCLKRDLLRIGLAIDVLEKHNIGATAIGTSLNADPEYIKRGEKHLRDVTGLDGLTTAENLIDETQNSDEFVHASGLLRVLATNLSKICGDLILLSSGPIGGFHEITLPPVQPGSSIMPGKVNPVICEMVMQCAFQVIGHDGVISLAAQAGQLELNAYEPVIAYNFFQAVKLLRNSMPILTNKCIKGIEPNKEGLDVVHKSVGLVTALNPVIGYKAASRIAKKALDMKKPVREIVLEEGILDENYLDVLLSPERMTSAGIADHQHDPVALSREDEETKGD